MLDQGELEWFLSFGVTLFERSTTGAILDGVGVIEKAFKTLTGRHTYGKSVSKPRCDNGGSP